VLHGVDRTPQRAHDLALPPDEATDLSRAIDLAENGRIELSSLLSERYALSDGSEAFASLSERRGLKVVVEPQRGDA
jgi:threonine dehydrogenase-like Zn-dependent dehydrogenase